MSKVVYIEDYRPHARGKAVCIHCGYIWEAIAPLETEWLECKKCGFETGHFVHPYYPGAGEEIWTCACGNDLMYILKEEVFCPNCGQYQILSR